ncbi:MAG TPA: hypothetical protein VFX98_09025 [Longimicrobiaceae bacterium]|nr:hypothetical protein [Longimicrobiaceae bacterium]
MKIRRTLAAVLVVAALAACGEQPTEPRAPAAAPAQVLGGLIDLNGVLQFAGLPDLSGTRHAEKFIDASEGGFVELDGFRVDIPAGALPYDATVTIDLPTDNVLGKRLIAEFGPHGIQFNTPVTLTFPLTGVVLNGNPIGVARWENGGWTELGGSVTANGTKLTGSTPRFSTYGGKYILTSSN